MKTYVGLGEGIGNVVMGLAVVNELLEYGHQVDLGLAMTPVHMAPEIGEVLRRAFPTVRPGIHGPYDVACLTHWYVSAGGEIPEADELRVGPAVTYDQPEILQDLETLEGLVGPSPTWGRAHLPCGGAISEIVLGGPYAVVHPGCKPTWRGAKMYPRWAEAIHRLEDEGLPVTVLGGVDDRDIYCGRPDADLRGECSLAETVEILNGAAVVVSGDSGLHHLAVALGWPTVAIFGQSSIEKARHPNPPGAAPVVLGPFAEPERLAAVSPRVIARAAKRAVERQVVEV